MARHVIDTYFQDTLNPMVRHHLDSFREFLDVKIPRFIKASNPRSHIVDDNRTLRVYIGGKSGDKLKYKSPVDEEGNAILPHKCRLENKTYSFDIYATIDIEYVMPTGEVESKTFENIYIGSIPLMVKSSLCYLSSMTSDELHEAGECKFELGGYFIVDGQERVLLTQERLGNNMFYAKERKILKESTSTKGRLTARPEQYSIEGVSKEEDIEYICGIRSASEDGTLGPYGHQVTIPSARRINPDDVSKTVDYGDLLDGRLVLVQLPRFSNPVPIVSVFYALGFTSDKDIYDVILAGTTEGERTQYDGLFLEMILSHERFIRQEMAKEEDQTEEPNLLFLRRQTRTRSQGAVFVNLFRHLFPHCEVQEGESTASFYRRKGYLLGHMVRMAMDVALGIRENSDRDHYRFKRLDVSGEICFQEFRRTYNDTVSSMLTKMDSRVHFEQQTYKGRAIINLVNEDNLSQYFWSKYDLMTNFSKGFKGKWGGKDGVSQVLARYSYLGTIAHLRRVNLDMDKGTKLRPPRQIHASSWGLMCPTDNPDGGNVGMIKSMSLFCTISEGVSISVLKPLLADYASFLPLAKIHPSTWNSTWTKVFLNSDLVGVITKETGTFHSMLLGLRRDQKLHPQISLTWNQVDNEYLIFTDAGRPCRPIYREGVKQEAILATKSWPVMRTKYMDYVDSQEAECLYVSMESFHPTRPSEIHASTMFAPSASVVPHPEHSQAPRSTFSCQQTKQAASWFNTAFSKRFDKMAMVMHTPQTPLSQSWTYRHILGNNGCLPYGENAIIAISMYSGYNQDDSLILNDSAIKRGMFGISYYHTYTIEEEMIDPNLQIRTEIANLVENPRFRESVVRQPDMEYTALDGDGYVRIGTEVNENTILAGIAIPILKNGQIVGYRDGSQKPNRGQRGIVDAVYRFTGKDGLHRVKIRVVEAREPVFGDKFSARSGQKGTCGIRMPEEDMPFTASGLRPDMIVNPHGFPSRMTIGQFIESMSTKIGLQLGSMVDSTPFTASNRIGDLKETLVQMGFHPYGHDIMYNGQTGEMMETEIFMGPVYYLRLKHMVEDKINYRTTGPRTLLTHQPLEGRANDGGLRIGEMERDAIISHGMSKFLNESLMDRSDAYDFLFQPDTGRLDGSPEVPVTELHMPYAMRLFLQEMEAMHIQTKLASP